MAAAIAVARPAQWFKVQWVWLFHILLCVYTIIITFYCAPGALFLNREVPCFGCYFSLVLSPLPPWNGAWLLVLLLQYHCCRLNFEIKTQWLRYTFLDFDHGHKTHWVLAMNASEVCWMLLNDTLWKLDLRWLFPLHGKLPLLIGSLFAV